MILFAVLVRGATISKMRWQTSAIVTSTNTVPGADPGATYDLHRMRSGPRGAGGRPHPTRHSHTGPPGLPLREGSEPCSPQIRDLSGDGGVTTAEKPTGQIWDTSRPKDLSTVSVNYWVRAASTVAVDVRC